MLIRSKIYIPTDKYKRIEYNFDAVNHANKLEKSLYNRFFRESRKYIKNKPVWKRINIEKTILLY